MSNLNFSVAMILFILWAVEYFVAAGSIIHLLLIAPTISLLSEIAIGNKAKPKPQSNI